MISRLCLAFLFCLLTATAARAQYAGVAAAAPTDAPVATAAPAAVNFRHMPTLEGGPEAFKNYLRNSLVYPEDAREYAVEGTVVVLVAVDAQGRPTVKGVEKALFPACDEAALAAAAQLPRFLPAVRDGQAVARTLRVPFYFRLR